MEVTIELLRVDCTPARPQPLVVVACTFSTLPTCACANFTTRMGRLNLPVDPPVDPLVDLLVDHPVDLLVHLETSD